MLTNNSNERDILADILNDSHSGNVRGLAELSKLIHMTSPGETLMPARSNAKKASFPPQNKKKNRRKRKSTHYLNQDVFENLGEAKRIIKDFMPAGSKAIATKSQIVESAIKVLLGEFEEKGENSYLVKELLKKNKSK